MAGANSQINFVGLDFDSIKNNLKTYLRSQDTFKDYNFDGSGLSTLLDVLAYNTQYNAFYLNMVANEMFLDTALQRSSVVSQAKVLNYVPTSATAPTAFADIVVNGVTTNSLTLPAYTNFLSESVDGVNYNFVSTESTTVDVTDQQAIFGNIELKQGIPVTTNSVVDSTTNPNYTFEIPDADVDTSTISVSVQKSSTNSYSEIYNLSDSYSSIDGSSKVYFLEEKLNGNYQISFGDGILGNRLIDGNIVSVSYVITQGLSATGANNFVLLDSVTGFTNVSINPVMPASKGKEKESIESIKFQAPKSFAAQKRAVTKEDYITLLQQNKIGLSFDAVNVWGGEENNPPVYGTVFICLKPKGAYTITDTQKQQLLLNAIDPVSIMTVKPKIIDPDYTYIQITADVLYDSKKTGLSASQIQQLIKNNISNYAANTLNTFNSTISGTDIGLIVKNSNISILTSDISFKLQKKFYPSLTEKNTYNLYYNTNLQKGTFLSGISSSPTFQVIDETTLKTITGLYIEEIPSTTGGVETISVINPGYSYQYTPTITLLGDGTGANATATLVNGAISKINVIESGQNYTSVTVKITPSPYDTTGTGAVAVANLQGKYGTLRSYYFNSNNIKTIMNSKIGTVDYENGIVTLNSFLPYAIDNDLGQLTITSIPKSRIIESTYNTIITVDPYDPNAIIVNVTNK